MDNTQFSRFAPLLRDMTEAQLASEIERPRRLLLATGMAGGKRIDIAYAPLDHVNVDARIVIVGLTPGRQQMRNALMEAHRCLRAGRSDTDTQTAVKAFAAFSGPMRAPLIAMLDSIGVNRLLGLQSVASLWDSDAHLAHFTSALRYPVFIDGKNYSGAPPLLATPLLREQFMTRFVAEAAALRHAIFVPLGTKVGEAVELAAEKARLDCNRVLTGLPHPSGANAERIAFFLGRKARQALSPQVRPERLIAARTELKAKIAMLAAEHGDRAQKAWLDLENLVDDANHLAVIDQPDVVAQQLQKFLGAKMRRRPSGALTSE